MSNSDKWLLAMMITTLPVSFVAIALWIVREGDTTLEATVAGGLIGILSAIVSGFFNVIGNNKNREKE